MIFSDKVTWLTCLVDTKGAVLRHCLTSLHGFGFLRYREALPGYAPRRRKNLCFETNNLNVCQQMSRAKWHEKPIPFTIEIDPEVKQNDHVNVVRLQVENCLVMIISTSTKNPSTTRSGLIKDTAVLFPTITLI